MDYEARFYRRLGLWLPVNKVTARLGRILFNRLLIPFYLRKPRPTTISSVHGFQMELDPSQCVDKQLLFCQRLYDFCEMHFLQQVLLPGDRFVDVGAHVGFYSLMAASLVGETGKVIAIEAEPKNYRQLCKNIALNQSEKIILAINQGVSDKTEELWLGLNTSGNAGGHSFVKAFDQTILISCQSLARIFEDLDFKDQIKVMKLDIEGFEYKVLKDFFSAPRQLPQFIIIEHLNILNQQENPISLLETLGYKPLIKTPDNLILQYTAKHE